MGSPLRRWQVQRTEPPLHLRIFDAIALPHFPPNDPFFYQLRTFGNEGIINGHF